MEAVDAAVNAVFVAVDWKAVHECKANSKHVTHRFATNVVADYHGEVSHPIAPSNDGLLVHDEFVNEIERQFTGVSFQQVRVGVNQSRVKRPLYSVVQTQKSSIAQLPRLSPGFSNHCLNCGFSPLICVECGQVDIECGNCGHRNFSFRTKKAKTYKLSDAIVRTPIGGDLDRWGGEDFFGGPPYPTVSSKVVDWLVATRVGPIAAAPFPIADNK